ncbi:MAG: hypothetical protein IPM04_00535 [Saprospiraceae bacterium]|nr:hypothetical protein [Candidatus Brachybacter algidus]MBK8746370.1 hypothetical protein [Candidatus Brachybacter algidus]
MHPIVKPYEFVEFKNKLLQIVNSKSNEGSVQIWPLESYLKSIDLDGNYEAKWGVKDSKFFLVELLKCDKRIKEHFNLSKPVLAEWIDGFLELGIPKETKFKTTFPNHLLLRIEKGVIIEKTIIQIITSDQHLDYLGFNKQQRLNQLIY